MCIKYIIINVIVIFILTPLFATDVSGEVQGQWLRANSPYNVIGDIEIPAGQVLTIDEGVEVIFTGLHRLTVYGNIEAIGTEADSIRFTGDSWDSIRLEDAPNYSRFEYCVITGADIAINAIYSSFEVYFSRLGHSTDKAISILGDGDTATIIAFSKIHDTVNAGISLTNVYKAYIITNEITRCVSGTMTQGAIHYSIQSAITPPIDEYLPHIVNNHIHHNYKQGITTWDITSADCMKLSIDNNLVEYNLTGIYLRSTSGQVKNNLIRNNYITGDTNSGAGIMVAGAGNVSVSDNIVTGNFTGFFFTENASPTLADGNNIIYNNVDGSGANWSIYLWGVANNINATGNYFHSSDPTAISISIFDRNDYPSLGEVTFLPVETGGLMTGNIGLPSFGIEQLYYQFTFEDTQQINQPFIITTERYNPDYVMVVPAGVYDVSVRYGDTSYTDEVSGIVITENAITTGVDFTLSDTGSISDDTMPRPSVSVNCYPNPILAGNSVKFNLKSDTRQEMTLELFNIKGQKIATVFRGIGDNRIISYTLDRNMPSGVYFYRLKTKDFALTKKMVIVK